MNIFAKNLRYLRKQRKISQPELAEKVNLHFQQIGRYERGTSSPPVEVVLRIAKALDISVTTLLTGENNQVIIDTELLELVKKVDTFDDNDRLVVKAFIDALLFSENLKKIIE